MKSIKALCGALAAIIAFAALLAGCSGPGEAVAEITTAADTTQTEAVTTELRREDTPDTLPELDYNGSGVRITYRGDDMSKLLEMEGDDTGDVVGDVVFARNRSIEERFNVKLEHIPGSANHDAFMNAIKPVLLSGDDAYDIVNGIQWLMLPQAADGLYYDLGEAPYIDFDMPWWDNTYMDIISVDGRTRYGLCGDIAIWRIRMMSAMFFNKTLYEGSFGDPDGMYKTVLDGKWTHELMRKYVSEIYQDLNGNGVTDEGDIIGASGNYSNINDHYCYTAGLRYSGRGKDGYPQLLTDHTRNVAVVESLYKLYFETEGFCFDMTLTYFDKNNIDWFKANTLLFHAGRIYGTDFLRDMEGDYGIIPYPKLNEEQESYYALVHDSCNLFGIPITVSDIEMPCTIIEAMCAENYRTVVPAYYETALKVKYARDQLSVQMMDLIHDNAVSDFVYANNYSLTGNLGTLTRTIMRNKSSDFMSAYEAVRENTEASIVKLIEKVSG